MTTSASTRVSASIVGEPLLVDYLCGRTAACANHPGTRYVKERCRGLVGTYLHAEKPTKEAINAQIVIGVYARGGRFLVKDEAQGGWFPLDFVRARQRVSAVFRNFNIARQMRQQKRRQQEQQPVDTVVVEDRAGGLEEFPADKEGPSAPWDSLSLPRSIFSNPMSIESCLHGTSMAGSSTRSAMDIVAERNDSAANRPQHVVEQHQAPNTTKKEKEEPFSDISSDGSPDESVFEAPGSCEANAAPKQSPEAQKISASSETIMSLVRRLTTHGRSYHTLLECFREIAEQMWLTGACHELAVLSASMDSISNAMAGHTQDSQIQRYGCLAMAHMTSDPASSVDISTTLRSVDAVVTAMRCHLSNEEVQGYGMWALGNFSQLERSNFIIRQHVVESCNGIEVIVAAMQRHSSIGGSTGRSCQFVQRYGCFALSHIVTHANYQRRTFESGGFAVVIDAMREHLTDEDVQTGGCKTLVAFVMSASGMSLDPRTVLTPIKAAMGEYPANEQIQSFGGEIRQALELYSNPRLSSLASAASTKQPKHPLLPDGRWKVDQDEATQATQETATLTTLSCTEGTAASTVIDSGDLEQQIQSMSVVDQRTVQQQSVHDAHADSGTFTGQVSQSNGLPHGYGRMIYNEGGRRYEGHWCHGRWHGRGTAVFANGDSYKGEYRNGERHGHGRYCWKEGRVYEGSFVNDRRHGRGVCKWSDGAVYDGEYVNGRREGYGHYSFADNNGYYTGSWLEDKFEGYGICQREDGRFYSGQWKGGRKHGPGVEISKGQEVLHDGEWRKGQPVLK